MKQFLCGFSVAVLTILVSKNISAALNEQPTVEPMVQNEAHVSFTCDAGIQDAYITYQGMLLTKTVLNNWREQLKTSAKCKSVKIISVTKLDTLGE